MIPPNLNLPKPNQVKMAKFIWTGKYYYGECDDDAVVSKFPPCASSGPMFYRGKLFKWTGISPIVESDWCEYLECDTESNGVSDESLICAKSVEECHKIWHSFSAKHTIEIKTADYYKPEFTWTGKYYYGECDDKCTMSRIPPKKGSMFYRGKLFTWTGISPIIEEDWCEFLECGTDTNGVMGEKLICADSVEQCHKIWHGFSEHRKIDIKLLDLV